MHRDGGALVGDAPAWPDDAVEVGRIIDAWGVKGWIKVQPFASDPQALFSSRRWFLKSPELSATPRRVVSEPPPLLLKITAVRRHGEAVVAQAQEVDDRHAAEALKGVRVFISRASFPSADPDEYYWVDLIGLAVINHRGKHIGRVVGLIETGPHCVLRVVSEGTPPGDESTERLIPFVSAYVGEVDLTARRITVDWDLDY